MTTLHNGLCTHDVQSFSGNDKSPQSGNELRINSQGEAFSTKVIKSSNVVPNAGFSKVNRFQTKKHKLE